MTDTAIDDATAAPLITELTGGVLVLRINRPSRRNAMNNDALHAISGILDQVERDGIRAIIVRGEGGTFCAGSDLKEMKRGVDYRREHTLLGQKVWSRLEHSPALTIALVEGMRSAVALSLHSRATFGWRLPTASGASPR